MVLGTPEAVVVELQHEVLDPPQRGGVVQPAGPAIRLVEREQQLIDAVRRTRVPVALDVDRLVDEPDQLQGLGKGLRRPSGDFSGNPGQFPQLRRPAGMIAALRLGGEELGVSQHPLAQTVQGRFGGGQEVQPLRIRFVLPAADHAIQHARHADPQQLAVTGREMSLMGEEFVVQRLRHLLDLRVGRLAANLRPELAPHVAIQPGLADLRRHLALEIAGTIRPLAGVDAVLAEPQLDHHRHGPGDLRDRTGQPVVRPQIERDRPKILAQGPSLADDPGPVLVCLEDPREGPRAVQRDADRRIQDLAAQGRDLRVSAGRRGGPHRAGTAGSQSRPAGRRAAARQESPPRPPAVQFHEPFSADQAMTSTCSPSNSPSRRKSSLKSP